MALMHLNFRSKYLSGNTNVNVILPDLSYGGNPASFYTGGKKYKVLWLLHGTFGDYSDWVRRSNVEIYAAEKEMIVVMPSGMTTDYVNWNGFGMGYRMLDYFFEELMPLIYGWLPASEKREDNFLAGLSMGGRGTLIYAMHRPEKFAAAYAMSACPQDMRVHWTDTTWGARNANRLSNTGGLEGFLASEQNTWDLTRALAGRKDLPRMILACGTKDPLIYEDFKIYRQYAQEVGFPAEFLEVEGYGHEWRLWEKLIQDALERFVPAGEKERSGK